MKLDYEIEIASPPEQLWTWLVEPEKQKQWMYGIVSNELTGGDGESVGSTFHMQIKEGGRISDYEGVITTYDCPSHLAIQLEGGCGKTPIKMDVDYRLAPIGGGSKLTYHAESELKGFFMRFMMVFFFWMPKMMVKKFMKKLRKVAEAEAQAV